MRREQIEHAHRVAGCALTAFGVEPRVERLLQSVALKDANPVIDTRAQAAAK